MHLGRCAIHPQQRLLLLYEYLMNYASLSTAPFQTIFFNLPLRAFPWIVVLSSLVVSFLKRPSMSIPNQHIPHLQLATDAAIITLTLAHVHSEKLKATVCCPSVFTTGRKSVCLSRFRLISGAPTQPEYVSALLPDHVGADIRTGQLFSGRRDPCHMVLGGPDENQ